MIKSDVNRLRKTAANTGRETRMTPSHPMDWAMKKSSRICGLAGDWLIGELGCSGFQRW